MEVASDAAKLSAIPALASLLSRSSGHSEVPLWFSLPGASLRAAAGERRSVRWQIWPVEVQIDKSKSTRLGWIVHEQLLLNTEDDAGCLIMPRCLYACQAQVTRKTVSLLGDPDIDVRRSAAASAVRYGQDPGPAIQLL